MNITVYLGASSGNDPTLETSVRALGRLIGKCGNALVYGGSKNGLLGALAESVLRAGGVVTGVEPQLFIDKGYEYDEITTLIVTRDMTERKTKMIELGDAFIAFPGGTGTLEEISEIMSKVSLKQLAAPCILYNLNGYYDHLKALLAHMIDMGISTPERQEGIDVSLAPQFNDAYQLRLGDTIVYRDDSYEIVKSLRGKVRQCVVSNGTVVAQTKKLTRSGLGALMDGVFLSEQLGAEKPKKEFFDQVFAAIGPVEKSETMIVGDSLTSDIRGGDNAGIVTCWYNPEGIKAPEGYRIDHEIRDLHEVYGLL